MARQSLLLILVVLGGFFAQQASAQSDSILFQAQSPKVPKGAVQPIVERMNQDPELRLEIKGWTNPDEHFSLGQTRAASVVRELITSGADSRRLSLTVPSNQDLQAYPEGWDQMTPEAKNKWMIARRCVEIKAVEP